VLRTSSADLARVGVIENGDIASKLPSEDIVSSIEFVAKVMVVSESDEYVSGGSCSIDRSH